MFRLNLSPNAHHPISLPPPVRAAGRTVLVAGIALLAFGMIAGWILARRSAPHDDRELDTGPILLSMQRIGQLHTVTYYLKDVLHQETQEEPEGWIGELPGGPELVHWATRNQALVVAEGSVEAGVDLSHLSARDVTAIKQADGSTLLRVHLPPIEVYPPNVHVRVEDDQAGPFWRDENIVPRAQAEASRRFLIAAEKGDIRSKAAENAIQTLDQIESALNAKNVRIQFTFGDSDPTHPSSLPLPNKRPTP